MSGLDWLRAAGAKAGRRRGAAGRPSRSVFHTAVGPEGARRADYGAHRVSG